MLSLWPCSVLFQPQPSIALTWTLHPFSAFCHVLEDVLHGVAVDDGAGRGGPTHCQCAAMRVQEQEKPVPNPLHAQSGLSSGHAPNMHTSKPVHHRDTKYFDDDLVALAIDSSHIQGFSEFPNNSTLIVERRYSGDGT